MWRWLCPAQGPLQMASVGGCCWPLPSCLVALQPGYSFLSLCPGLPLQKILSLKHGSTCLLLSVPLLRMSWQHMSSAKDAGDKEGDGNAGCDKLHKSQDYSGATADCCVVPFVSTLACPPHPHQRSRRLSLLLCNRTVRRGPAMTGGPGWCPRG